MLNGIRDLFGLTIPPHSNKHLTDPPPPSDREIEAERSYTLELEKLKTSLEQREAQPRGKLPTLDLEPVARMDAFEEYSDPVTGEPLYRRRFR